MRVIFVILVNGPMRRDLEKRLPNEKRQQTYIAYKNEIDGLAEDLTSFTHTFFGTPSSTLTLVSHELNLC